MVPELLPPERFGSQIHFIFHLQLEFLVPVFLISLLLAPERFGSQASFIFI